jgi:hypothetical protein
LLIQPVKGDHLVAVVAKLVPDLSLPIIKVRDSAVVTDRRYTARNVEQLLAQTPHVHVDDDDGAGGGGTGMSDEGVDGASRHWNVDQALFHGLPGRLQQGSEQSARRVVLSNAVKHQHEAGSGLLLEFRVGVRV